MHKTAFYENFHLLEVESCARVQELSKKTVFLSINLIFRGVAEPYLEHCQTSKMERVVKIVNSFLFTQNAAAYMFDSRRATRNVSGQGRFRGIRALP